MVVDFRLALPNENWLNGVLQRATNVSRAIGPGWSYQGEPADSRRLLVEAEARRASTLLVWAICQVSRFPNRLHRRDTNTASVRQMRRCVRLLGPKDDLYLVDKLRVRH